MEPWYTNICVWSFIVGWTVAQTIKFFVGLVKLRRLDFTYYVSTGGMPSAHSACVTSLATAVGLAEGFHTSMFALAITFALIVMFDAQSVRRAAGEQARIMNQMVEELFKNHTLSQKKLHELLGHTRLEVFVGAAIGIMTALLIARYWSS
jgi:acid phosphatase family membrane protein YuiD